MNLLGLSLAALPPPFFYFYACTCTYGSDFSNDDRRIRMLRMYNIYCKSLKRLGAGYLLFWGY